MSSKFEDLVVFKAGVELSVDVYNVTAAFPASEKYGLAAQLRRASVSVVSQIAEGQGRLSFGEWRQWLSQARGSLYEIEAQLIVASRLTYIDAAAYQRLRTRCRQVGSPLAGLIRFVQAREQRTKQRRGNRQPVTGNST